MQEEQNKPSYYAIIPASIRYDKRLKPNEKLLYGEITSLCNENGNCWASNKYFSELYEVEIETISRWIKHLKDLGYIDTEILYKDNTKAIDKRTIKIIDIPIDKKINTYCLKSQEGIDKKVKENNISINNIKEINNNKLLFTKKNFQKPTLEEIQSYCEERNNNIDAQQFYDFYESKGWLIGKNKMKDWKAAIRTWERNSNQDKNKQNIKKQIEPEWFNQKIEKEELSEEERKELDELMSKYR